MEPAEIAWAAGLFEGEGAITTFGQKKHVLPLIRLVVQMTDGDVVEHFCRVVECGHVCGPIVGNRPAHHKPIYSWSIGNRRDVERILRLFLPWFGARRSGKAQQMLAEIAKLDRSCRQCGAKFRARRMDQWFCGVKCRNRWNYLNRRPAERPSQFGRPRTL